jgi:lipoprotein-releasing system permease protein
MVMNILEKDKNLKDKQESDTYVVKDWREIKGEFFKSVAFEKMMSSLMLGLIIIVAVFNMMSSLVMVVTSKMSEIAILRTLGMTRRNIVSVFIIEGCISGIVGTIFGGILGITLLFNLDQVLSLVGVRLYLSNSGAGIPFDINVMQVAIVMLSTVFFSILITIYPSYRASRINPVEFLRYE